MTFAHLDIAGKLLIKLICIDLMDQVEYGLLKVLTIFWNGFIAVKAKQKRDSMGLR